MNKKWLIHFSGDDYWFSNPHSRRHITFAFNKEYNVLWVNPMGSRIPSVKKSFFFNRIFRKLKSLFKSLKNVNKNLFVVTFFTIPFFRRGSIERINNYLLRSQLKSICKRLHIDKPLLFYSSPVYGATLGMIEYESAIYYYSDQYTEYREFDEKTRKYTEWLDQQLYTRSDLIVCASEKIFENVKPKTRKKVIYLPHQVDYTFFARKPDLPAPQDIASIKKPIIGYYGSLSDSNDWELIRYCATNRPHYNFVFIGRKDTNNTRLEDLPNVYFIGKKPLEEIPLYGHQFDVALMFWIRRPWIMHCSPLKLKEYLSMGIPVVSTFIEEVKEKYDGIVLSSKNSEEFLMNLDSALDPVIRQELVSRGKELVKKDSWNNVVAQVKSELLL